MTFVKSYIYILLVLFIASCEPIQLYEQTTIYPAHEWSSKQVNNYQFNITDTNDL